MYMIDSMSNLTRIIKISNGEGFFQHPLFSLGGWVVLCQQFSCLRHLIYVKLGSFVGSGFVNIFLYMKKNCVNFRPPTDQLPIQLLIQRTFQVISKVITTKT